MSIKLQLKNFAKLLLIGAVLFVTCSLASDQAVKRVSANANGAFRADAAKSMFARAGEQIKLESPNYLLVGEACVKAAVPPVSVTPKVLGAIVGDAANIEETSDSRKAIIEHQTEPGDTVAVLAEKYGISAETIAWANDIKIDAVLKPEQKLIIPPVIGVVHYAAAGDTISKIAQNYKADAQDIIGFNELSGEEDVFIGDVLMIPQGKMPQVVVPQKPYAQNTPKAAEEGVSLTSNYFLCPVGSPCRKTQGMHFRNAVDLTGGYCGAPIYAAASGTVTRAKLGGWNGGAGNNITISHMAGAIITHYYHLQSLLVVQGQEVRKGDVIGFMGKTGKSTGCHLHFEVIGASNPFNK